jgi:hypothetical protein
LDSFGWYLIRNLGGISALEFIGIIELIGLGLIGLIGRLSHGFFMAPQLPPSFFYISRSSVRGSFMILTYVEASGGIGLRFKLRGGYFTGFVAFRKNFRHVYLAYVECLIVSLALSTSSTHQVKCHPVLGETLRNFSEPRKGNNQTIRWTLPVRMCDTVS